jgi:hypothetical protein
MRPKSAIIAATLLITLSGCAAYSLVTPAPTTVSAGLQVTPGEAWNRVANPLTPYAASKVGKAEYWTADGNLLNLLSFHAGLKLGASLFRSVDKQTRPMPPFRADMTLAEIPEWVESSLRLRAASGSVTLGEIKPITFLQSSGVQFDFTFVDDTQVRRRGRGAASIINGQLFLILYEGTAQVYFDRRIADVDRMIASARRTS